MSDLQKAIEVVREVLSGNGIRPEQFFLFGSRARGDSRPDSDWDIYVVVDRDLSFTDRRRLVTEMRRTLARLRIPNDIVLKPVGRFNALKDLPGTLAYDVAREGVVL